MTTPKEVFVGIDVAKRRHAAEVGTNRNSAQNGLTKDKLSNLVTLVTECHRGETAAWSSGRDWKTDSPQGPVEGYWTGR
jgi:hypothetical protein